MTHYFATVAKGLETIAADEVRQLGAEHIQLGVAGVAFQGDRQLMYRVNLWASTIFRLLLTLKTIPCDNADDLYEGVQTVEWSRYLSPTHTLAVDVTGGNRQLNHTHFTALQVKNAIVDWQRSHYGQRSSVDTRQPDVRINVHVYRNRATLSLDSSGTSLHRRGYRPAMGKAPLKETLAAALIQLSDWTPEQSFLDPLCGSGTLTLEAGLTALNVAPGLFRERFGFMSWPDFDSSLWNDLRQDAQGAQLENLPALIAGSDRDGAIVEQARINAANCGLGDRVRFAIVDLADIEAPASSGTIICNPPYGERIGRSEDLGEFYKLLGDVLKQRFKGWTAFVLSGNKELARYIRLKSASRTPVWNGSIPCQLLKYELY